MDLGLAGKVAWVGGGSSGIGRACATSLAREGASVAISARRSQPLERAAAEIAAATGARCIAVPADLSDSSDIDAAAGEVARSLGPVDVLVSNSGGPPAGSFDSLDEGSLRAAFEITTASAWRLASAVVPDMRARGGGCLVFSTSWSVKEVIPSLLLSNSLRVAVVGFAKTLSKELGPHGIRVVCVAPGRIATPRLVELDEATAARTGRSVDEVAAESRVGVPLGRYGRPEEVGDVVAFLASERASYISGVTVLVDGGMLDGILS